MNRSISPFTLQCSQFIKINNAGLQITKHLHKSILIDLNLTLYKIRAKQEHMH
jgi:hypothetical protein